MWCVQRACTVDTFTLFIAWLTPPYNGTYRPSYVQACGKCNDREVETRFTEKRAWKYRCLCKRCFCGYNSSGVPQEVDCCIRVC
uniref:Putative secreted protein n=1 Tax=Ixodes ricinus TaxID=34613 RepID=A0A6B0U7Q9_IXORI